ncbi:hypothetical protein Barb4_03008 [Bacteroidales bacterium Barb4]|nr:hypothetical protein Barb4_03008 [Bacteroidales bacterium Barb4]
MTVHNAIHILSSFQDAPDGIVPVTPHSADPTFRCASCGAEILYPFRIPLTAVFVNP